MSRLVTIDGAKVRELRTAAGLTQSALADQSGISARYISKIENGHVREVETETRAALAEVLEPDFEVTEDGRAALLAAAPLGQTTRRRVHGRIVAGPD